MENSDKEVKEDSLTEEEGVGAKGVPPASGRTFRFLSTAIANDNPELHPTGLLYSSLEPVGFALALVLIGMVLATLMGLEKPFYSK